MKIGIVADCFQDISWEKACETAKKYGFKAIEPGCGGYKGKTHCNPQKLLNDRDMINEFVKMANNNDLEISALSCHGNPLHPQKKISEKHIADLEASMKLASIIGIEVVNCFAGCPGAGKGAKYPNWITCPWPPDFGKGIKWQWKKEVTPFWEKMVKKAKKYGIKFGFELHPGDVLYNPETLIKLREDVGEEEISCNLDPSHFFWQGMDPILIIKKLRRMIIHVHLKDITINKLVVKFRGVNDWKDYNEIEKRAWNFSTIGEGHDKKFWNDFILALDGVGYKGVLNVENEDLILSNDEVFKKSIHLLKKIMN